MKKNHFGIIEMTGSIIMLLIDPQRRDNKRYLDKKFLHLNRAVGMITISVIISLVLWYVLK